MRRRRRTSAICSAASPESDHDVAPRGQVEHLLEKVALQRQVRLPARLRAEAADLEVEPVEPAGAGAADEVPQLDVERGDAAGVDLAGHLGDLAPEVARARAIEQVDFPPLELLRREVAQLPVLVDVRIE